MAAASLRRPRLAGGRRRETPLSQSQPVHTPRGLLTHALASPAPPRGSRPDDGPDPAPPARPASVPQKLAAMPHEDAMRQAAGRGSARTPARSRRPSRHVGVPASGSREDGTRNERAGRPRSKAHGDVENTPPPPAQPLRKGGGGDHPRREGAWGAETPFRCGVRVSGNRMAGMAPRRRRGALPSHAGSADSELARVRPL